MIRKISQVFYKKKGSYFQFPRALYLALILFTGCYERKEGCLDIQATNFDVGADDGCSDCCKFPQLKLAVLHRLAPFDTFTNLTLGAVYPILPDSQYLYKPEAIWFYLSEFELIATDGTIYKIEDTIEVKLLDPAGDTISQWLPDGVVLVNRNSVGEKTIGTIRATGNFSGVRFRVGLPETHENVLPASLPRGHALNFQGDSSNWLAGTGYVFQYWEYYPDTAQLETKVIKITDLQSQIVQLNQAFELKKGFDIRLSLRIDYLEWWRGIDPLTMDSEAIKNRLLTNLLSAISLNSVQNI